MSDININVCPYCGKEMQSGNITGDGRTSVRFVPDDAEKGFLPSLERLVGGVGKINAVNYAYMNCGFTIKARFCADCKKMIFDTDLST